MNFVKTEVFTHLLGNLFAVAGEHDRLAAVTFKLSDCLFGIGLYHVGNDDMTEIFSVNRHMNNGSHLVAVVIFHIFRRHELAVAHKHLTAVDFRRKSLAGNFLYIFDNGGVDFVLAGIFKRHRNGVVGEIFRRRGYFNKLFLRNDLRMNGSHREFALGEGSRFVKNNG